MAKNSLVKLNSIDEATFAEIKAMQEDGVDAFNCAAEMNLKTEEVLIAYRFDDYLSFRKEELNLISESSDTEGVQKRLSMANTEYYKGLVAKKQEDTTNLTETRKYLLEQVSFLRKAVAFLEIRKHELEDGIKGLEKNVVVGIDMMRQLEEIEKEGSGKLPTP